MKHESLFITDLDETLQHVHEPLTDEEINILQKLMENGTFIAVISGASVQSIFLRLASKIQPRFSDSVIFYANNGGVCFQLNTDGSVKYIYNYSFEFEQFRSEIGELIEKWVEINALGSVVYCEGRYSLEGTLCIEHKECQITVTLRGLEYLREKIIVGLSTCVNMKFAGEIVVVPAGSKSIDIMLSKTGKKEAIQHLLITLSVGIEKRNIVIAGDSFHDGGADNELLHLSLKGSIVFCAGNSVPQTESFVIIKTPRPSPSETYKFLKNHFRV